MISNTTLHYTALDIVGRDDAAEYSGPGVYYTGSLAFRALVKLTTGDFRPIAVL